MNFSYWEWESFPGTYDYIVVGAGIVGLNAAISLKARQPQKRVAVLERGFLPAGASSKNAGFACFGSVSELWEDLGKMPRDTVLELVEMRWRGLKALRSLLGDEKTGYEGTGGFELFTAGQNDLLKNCRELIPELNHEIGKITGLPEVYRLNNDHLHACGFAGVEAVIENSGEGLIHTGRMAKNLLRLALERGVDVWMGMEVEAMESIAGKWKLSMSTGLQAQAGAVLIAVNGFAKKVLPELDVEPARAQVLITSPLGKVPFRGGHHYDRGYFYFRDVGNRVLFGGGRNLDFEAENTAEFGLTPLVQDELERLLREVILPGQPFAVERRWSGVMGVGPSKETIMKEIEPGLFCAVRMGGMGVAIGTLIGQQAAAMLLGD